MNVKNRLSRFTAAAGIPLLLAAAAGSSMVWDAPPAQAATTGPCDIYASGGNGTKLILWTCTGQQNQRWTPRS